MNARRDRAEWNGCGTEILVVLLVVIVLWRGVHTHG